jgi:hypothetical protein
MHNLLKISHLVGNKCRDLFGFFRLVIAGLMINGFLPIRLSRSVADGFMARMW